MSISAESFFVRVTCSVAVLSSLAVASQAVEYNVPPDPVPSVVGDGDVLNAYAGAMFPEVGSGSVELLSGSTLNYYGEGYDPGVVFGRAGSVVNLYDGFTFSNEYDGTVNVYGGLGHDLVTNGANVLIDGPVTFLEATSSAVEMTGGLLLEFYGSGTTTVSIDGGELSTFFLNDQTSVLFSGGRFDTADDHGGRNVGADAELIFRGGDLTPFTPAPFWPPQIVTGSGLVGFRGTNFAIDSVPIDGLLVGDMQVLTERDVLLSGNLADGAYFEFPLNSDTLTYQITVTPEPAAAMLESLILLASLAPRMRRDV